MASPRHPTTTVAPSAVAPAPRRRGAVRAGASRGGGRRGGGRWGTADQRHRNGTWGGSKDHGKGSSGTSAFGSSVGGSSHADFSQDRFSGLRSGSNTAAECKDEEKRLLESVVKDMQVWESSGQWLFSSYSPLKEKPNVPGFLDVSPEELRLEYYTRVANGDVQSYYSVWKTLSFCMDTG